MKKAVKNLAIFTRKYLSALRPATLLKIDTNTGVCETFQNTYSEEPLRTAASKEYVIQVTNSVN